MTSLFMSADGGSDEQTVCIELDGEESELRFLNITNPKVRQSCRLSFVVTNGDCFGTCLALICCLLNQWMTSAVLSDAMLCFRWQNYVPCFVLVWCSTSFVICYVRCRNKYTFLHAESALFHLISAYRN